MSACVLFSVLCGSPSSRMHGLRAAGHVRVEFGNRGHEKLAACVDGRRTRRRGPRTADVCNASVLDDHRLSGENDLAIHGDHRNAREDDGRLLRCRKGGDADGEEEYTGSERRTKHGASGKD